MELKEEIKSFQTKKKLSKSTIIKEVRSKNVILHIPVCIRFQFAHSSLHIALHKRSWSSTSARGVATSARAVERGGQELSNKKKIIKIGPLLRKLEAKCHFAHTSLHKVPVAHSSLPHSTPRALVELHERSWSCTSARGVERGDQELSNKKKIIKIGPLLRKLQAKMSTSCNFLNNGPILINFFLFESS